MRYTFKNEIEKDGRVARAIFEMWEMEGIIFKKRAEHGIAKMDSNELEGYCEAFSSGRNPPGSFAYAPRIEDHGEFQRALWTLKEQ